jgi:hypothetical protein
MRRLSPQSYQIVLGSKKQQCSQISLGTKKEKNKETKKKRKHA